MQKLISVSPINNLSDHEIEKVLINVDQIVAVKKYSYMYRIITTAIKPGNHGSMSVSFDVSSTEFEEKFASLLE